MGFRSWQREKRRLYVAGRESQGCGSLGETAGRAGEMQPRTRAFRGEGQRGTALTTFLHCSTRQRPPAVRSARTFTEGYCTSWPRAGSTLRERQNGGSAQHGSEPRERMPHLGARGARKEPQLWRGRLQVADPGETSVPSETLLNIRLSSRLSRVWTWGESPAIPRKGKGMGTFNFLSKTSNALLL